MTYKELYGEQGNNPRAWDRLTTTEVETSFWQDIWSNQGPILSVWLLVMLLNLAFYAFHG